MVLARSFSRCVYALGVLLLPGVAMAGQREAAAQVRLGMEHYEQGQYDKAGEAFAEADVALPDDPRIAYDQACVCLVRGDTDKAIELFQKAALAPKGDLAVECHYNLGCLAAAKGRSIFGNHPEDATPEVRQEGLAELANAVAHYRDCLKLDADHADARHNLETIRLWIKHMQAVWQQRDREKQRDELDLLRFLMMIDAEQRAHRAAAKALVDIPSSPQRRQALSTAASSQRQLFEEIEPLKEKIATELSAAQPPAAQPGAAPPAQPSTDPEVQRAIELLTGLADEAGKAMTAAADQLDTQSPDRAAEQQATALEKLDQIYMAVVPFANLVQRAVNTQQGLVHSSGAAVESLDAEDSPEVDYAEMAFNQRYISRWAEILGPKAEHERQQLESAPPSAGLLATTPLSGGPATTQAPDPQQAQEQTEALKKSMEKAIELAPQVHKLSVEAVGHLDQQEPKAALPKQEEALKLLKEIADPLPKQDQQQQGDQQQNQDQQDQQQQQDQNQQDENRQQNQQRQQQEMSRQQAESVLRKARQRQREHRDEQRRLQQAVGGPVGVDKDW